MAQILFIDLIYCREELRQSRGNRGPTLCLQGTPVKMLSERIWNICVLEVLTGSALKIVAKLYKVIG